MRKIPITENMRPQQLTTRPVNGYGVGPYAPNPKPEKARIDQLGDLLGQFRYGELMELDNQLIKVGNAIQVDIGDKGAFAELLWQFYRVNRAEQLERTMTEIADEFDFPPHQSPSHTGDFE